MYLPWVGFLAQMALADVFIWLDDVQFSKGSYTNRIQVKTPTGSKWMSIPLKEKGSFKNIFELASVGNSWIKSHRGLLSQSLRGRLHTASAISIFDSAAETDSTLCDKLIVSAEALAKHLDILPCNVLKASNLNIKGNSWSRVLELVKSVSGTEYITGHGALGYLDHGAFESQGITVRYMDYAPLPWPQPFDAFTPYVTGLDFVASLGAAEAKCHLRPASIDWRSFISLREKLL